MKSSRSSSIKPPKLPPGAVPLGTFKALRDEVHELRIRLWTTLGDPVIDGGMRMVYTRLDAFVAAADAAKTKSLTVEEIEAAGVEEDQ